MEALSTPVDVMSSPSPASLAALARKKGARAQLEEKAKDFESVFMAQMIKPMWEGVETDPVFGGGTGEDVMRDMMIQEYGKAMAKADNYGLSKSVMDVMIRIQEKAQGGTV